MELLKTYTISTDISAGAVDSTLLDSEISATSHVTNFTGIGVTGDNLKIYGDAFANEAALDTLVFDHVIDPLKTPTKEYIERSQGRRRQLHRATRQLIDYQKGLGDGAVAAKAKVTNISTEVAQYVSVYIMGNKQPLKDAVNASTLPFMNAAAKTFIISTL